MTPGKDDGPFAVDTFALPEKNPWNAQLRLTGFDFYPDGKRMAVCSWDGDVWLVGGSTIPKPGSRWQRIASGLFQPLGLKIRDGHVFVCCRDQIVRLHDLNGDGETDFYECFNNDHQVTEHFHEFAMGLQTDAEGNFYYAKSGRHALPGARAAPRHAPEGEQGRGQDGDPGHRIPGRQRRVPEPGRHVLRHRPGRVLDPEEPHQPGRRRAASTATCGATRTSPTRRTRR